MRGKHVCPNRGAFEGNNGGSFIEIDATEKEGIIRLRVGETCVMAVDQEISVVGLAAVLAWAKREGFEKIAQEWWRADDLEVWSVFSDPINGNRAEPPRSRRFE